MDNFALQLVSKCGGYEATPLIVHAFSDGSCQVIPIQSHSTAVDLGQLRQLLLSTEISSIESDPVFINSIRSPQIADMPFIVKGIVAHLSFTIKTILVEISCFILFGNHRSLVIATIILCPQKHTRTFGGSLPFSVQALLAIQVLFLRLNPLIPLFSKPEELTHLCSTACTLA